MDDKQIDLSKPLISVRRQSTKGASSERHDDQNQNRIDDSRIVIPRLPYYISELKSGPIINPGAVPFQWEHKPGKPKAELKPEVHVAPKLPPGRYFKGIAADMENANSSMKSPFLNEGIKDSEKLIKETEGKKSSSDSDDEYVDAHDILSRTEPSYLNCGTSDISVMDDTDENRNCPTDRQANEFMMKRFLPAAKAIASETPTYLPQKQSSVSQSTLQVKQGVAIQGRPELRYGPSFAKKYSHFGLDTAVEEDDNDNDDEKERDFNRSFPGVCGLFSGLCLKSPFYLQNHAPNLNLRSRSPFSPATRTLPEKDSDSSDSVVEKTVLIDTLQKVKAPCSSPANDHQTISQIMNQMDETDSSTDDDIRESIDEEWKRAELQLLNSYRAKNRAKMAAYYHRKQSDIDVPQSTDDAEKHLNRQRTPNNSLALPLPPPLPKSPSDSWLSRALPSLSASSPQKAFATRSSFAPATNWNSSKEKLKSIPECDEDH